MNVCQHKRVSCGFGETSFEKPRLLSKRTSGDPYALVTENIYKK